MNGFGNWLRNLGYRMRTGLQHFMSGRYGTDKLNMVILCTGLFCSLLASFIPGVLFKLILTIVAYAFMIIAIFRSFSRNVYKRYEENRKFLFFFQKIL